MNAYRTAPFWFPSDTNLMRSPVRRFVVQKSGHHYCLSREDHYRQNPFTVDKEEGASSLNVYTHIDTFADLDEAIKATVGLIADALTQMRTTRRWHGG